MRIKAFILFPDTEDDFVRIGDTAKAYEDLIVEVAIIKQQLRVHKDFELWYDSENVNAFLTRAEQIVGGIHLANCRIQIQRIFGNNVQNVCNTTIRKNDCLYVSWNISCSIDTVRELIADAAESKHSEDNYRTVLINIADAYTSDRDSVHVIKDAIHYNELPFLISIPIVGNEIEFTEWASTLSVSGFSLRDKNRFERTPYRWKKQWIFREMATGHYWYYDYFHKDNKQHYEVFGSDGRNLGISNIEGVLDESEAKGERRIDHIIQ